MSIRQDLKNIMKFNGLSMDDVSKATGIGKFVLYNFIRKAESKKSVVERLIPFVYKDSHICRTPNSYVIESNGQQFKVSVEAI